MEEDMVEHQMTLATVVASQETGVGTVHRSHNSHSRTSRTSLGPHKNTPSFNLTDRTGGVAVLVTGSSVSIQLQQGEAKQTHVQRIQTTSGFLCYMASPVCPTYCE